MRAMPEAIAADFSQMALHLLSATTKAIDSDRDGAATATEERYVYDGEHIALVFYGEGNQLSRYLHGPQIDQVLAEETAAGEVRWALSDHQGSVRDVVDSQGNVLNHITYDSYGQVTSETNPELDFRFGYTGRERDEETGLYYYRNIFSAEGLLNQQWGVLSVPTLMIWGENDAALGKELTDGTEAYVTDFTIRYIADCSHWVQQEQPALVNQYIRDFLARDRLRE